MKRLSYDEMIDREARQIAREFLQAKLAEMDLPLPRENALETHIDKLIKLHPEFTELATARVDAKADSYSESLKVLGLGSVTIKPFDLDPNTL